MQSTAWKLRNPILNGGGIRVKTQNNSNAITFIVVLLRFIFVFSPLISGCGGDGDTSDNQSIGSIRGAVFPAVPQAEVWLLSDGQQIATPQPNLRGSLCVLGCNARDV